MSPQVPGPPKGHFSNSISLTACSLADSLDTLSAVHEEAFVRLIRLMAVGCLLASAARLLAGERIVFDRAHATFHAGADGGLACVFDGIPTGPQGWSVAPRIDRAHALVLHAAQPVEAHELDLALYFLCGRPNNAIAEFALTYTTDDAPSLGGNWLPLEIQRFGAEVATLKRTEDGHLRADVLPDEVTGLIPDDTYRVTVRLPGHRATGFRLQVFPVHAWPDGPAWMSWGSPHDFTLTEFRAEVHARETTDIALYSPVTASHPLCGQQRPDTLTDGLPATIAHPRDEDAGAAFFFQLDLGRVAALDHLGLRARGEAYNLDRLSRLRLRLYTADPDSGAAPVWNGMDRADGSHPMAGAVDIVRASQGRGPFRGRYLRLSSDSAVPLSPQLAEVEVYETRTPKVIEALADGQAAPLSGKLLVAPGVRRLSFRLRIPQLGMPPDVLFRWRMLGDLDPWQLARTLDLELPCPRPGRYLFEAQALHSDNQWDAFVYRLPVVVRQHFWQSGLFRGAAGAAVVLLAMLAARLLTRQRAAQQLAAVRAQTALAEERNRIARDLHDDLGSSLTHIALLSELARVDADTPEQARVHVDDIFNTARNLTRALDEIVWAVNPTNDTVEKFAAFVSQFVQHYLRPAGLSCHLDLPDELPPRAMSAALRHNLFLVVKETLHNVVAHAAARSARFTLRLEEDRLCLRIADDGKGFDAPAASAKPGAGNGLQNMRKRMSDIGGAFDLASAPGRGTTVTLTVKL